ncbi:MAG: hypothetical protein MJY92_07045 [Bacteroidales bacterium]|nr:hypothetical protein [Bacteroidales bacterium]
MKRINKILMASIAMMTMVFGSCNKEKGLGQEYTGTISVSVNGILGEYVPGDDTKAELVNTTRVKWVEGDKVYVYDGANCLGELTVSLKDNKDYYAVLTGTEIAEPQTGASKLTLVYSNKFASAPEISDGKVSLDMSEQTGATSANNIPFVAYATLDYTSGTPEIQDQIADFSFATSIMRLICTGLEKNTEIREVTLCGMSDECVLDITKDGVSVGQGEIGDIDVTLSGVKASANGAQIIYAAVAKNTEEGHQTIHVEQTKGYFYSFGVQSRGVGKSINAVCQLESREVIPAKFSVSGTKRVYFSRANLWADASRNLHFEDDQHKVATSNGKWNTSHISYFSWASTLTKAISSFTSGAYDTSLFCNESNKISVDGSEAIYYALSSEEWMYLVNNRGENKFNFVSVNGKNGLVIAPDNATLNPTKLTYTEAELDDANLVFLPVGGHRRDNNTIYGPGTGHYLSSTINVPADKSFWSLNIRYEDSPKNVQLRSSVMDGGMLLRLVTDATN